MTTTSSSRLTGASRPTAQRARIGAVLKVPRRRRRELHPRSTEYLILVSVVGALCVAGLVMVLSASAVSSLRAYRMPWYYFERQGLYLGAGVVAFLVAHRVGMDRWRRLARPLFVVATCGLMAVLVAGRSAGGAARWLGSGSVQFQPSELAKLALVLFAADVLARREGKRDWMYRCTPVLVAILGFVGLIMKQPDMGTAVVICCIGAAILFTAGMPVRAMVGLGATGAVAGVVFATTASYRAARLTSFWDPFAHASSTGYQSVQGLIALGAGHWTGTGIGQSLASWGYLPNQYTDFIFAVIGQEAGFAGSMVMLGLFALLCVVGMRVSWSAETTFDALVAAGATAWLAAQAVINVGAVAGVLPVTGVPLPFVSYGGTSLVIVLFATGLLANIARRAPVAQSASGRAAARVLA
ncbi:MAG TPA: putative lipid II flippase FtsW [Acidimicrobiales bacterium]|nr:putative lipid II flippase FtsW [Acidimicrobiales bacterium]